MARALLLFPLLLSLAAFAQTEAPQFTAAIEVRVIDVDVVVTDAEGRPLTDLTREQFALYEDGKRVEIDYFSRIVDGRIVNMPDAAEAPRTPLTWVVYIDQTSIPPKLRNQAMRQLQAFLQNAISGGDRGVIALNDGRSFRVRQAITDDAKLLIDQLAKMEKEKMASSPRYQRTQAIRSEIRRAGSDRARELEFVAQDTANDINALVEEETSRTKNAIRAISALLDTLAKLEGRVALVYVGTGFNALPAVDLAEVWKVRFGEFLGATYAPRPERHRESVKRELARLYTNLSAHRVTVYTIHGAEEIDKMKTVDDRGSALGTIDAYVASTTNAGARAEAALAREMADRTGGLFFTVNEQLSSQLDAVRRDVTSYYSLGYKPAGTPGVAHEIAVKVSVPGARVRHRLNVREWTQNEQATGAVVASMVQPRVAAKVVQRAAVIPPAEPTAANPLGVAIEAERPKVAGWGREHVVAFNFSIQLDALKFVRSGGVHRAEFVMHFALVGQDGIVYPLESREQSLAVPDADLPSAKTNALVSYSWHVDLAPLKIPEDIPAKQEGMRLSVTVEDHASGTRSVVTVPLGKEKEKNG
jgi:VWFA-related protein